MNLFENETVNITEVLSVIKAEGRPEDVGRTLKYDIRNTHYELIYFFEGSDTCRFEDTVIYDKPGSVRYLPRHRGEGEYRVWNITPGYCVDIFFETESPMPDRAMGLTGQQGLADLFLKIYHLWSRKEPGYYSKVMSVLYEIIHRLNRQSRGSYSSAGRKLESAHAYILENYKNPQFDYRALCAVTGFSYSHFQNLFRSHYHLSPVKYVTRLRVDYAKELLLSKRYTVTEIAAMCGFENVYYFSRVFKEVTGVPPKQYR